MFIHTLSASFVHFVWSSSIYREAVAVFWVSMLAKKSLGMFGHYLIRKGQKDVEARKKERYSHVGMECLGGV